MCSSWKMEAEQVNIMREVGKISVKDVGHGKCGNCKKLRQSVETLQWIIKL